MIPTKYLDELKNAANEEIDFTASFSEMFEGKYTTIGQKWHLHPNVVKKSLNANLGMVIACCLLIVLCNVSRSRR
jgi:hypothetical protein